ncbi:14659_t:CDS:2 [Dentiscutata erythropus]|uniref:14659_t:CDS:1 n=1 Tax=Dentiscutata erythropus TaxID=1348616 RepID=A0A9N9IS14_9GLOM|nr:14659_t:CDS:2 [Dentiscutata erythropus]
MNSQEESSSSFYKTTYTDQNNSKTNNTNTPSTAKFISSKKKKEKLEKVQIRVIERDKLPLSQLTNIESYLEGKESGEIDDRNNTDLEQPTIVNTISKTLYLIKDCPTR